VCQKHRYLHSGDSASLGRNAALGWEVCYLLVKVIAS